MIVKFLDTASSIRSRLADATLRGELRQVGSNFIYEARGAKFLTPALISIGNNVFFNVGAYLSGDITIGDNVMFGPHACLLSGNHLYAVRGKSTRFLRLTEDNPEQVEKLVIEAEAWVGANVTILGGVRVGTGAVIGASSVVCRSIPPLTVAVGNPCTAIRRIFAPEHAIAHLIELGYPASDAEAAVGQRERTSATLPVVDNTERWSTYLYRPLRSVPLAVDSDRIRS